MWTSGVAAVFGYIVTRMFSKIQTDMTTTTTYDYYYYYYYYYGGGAIHTKDSTFWLIRMVQKIGSSASITSVESTEALVDHRYVVEQLVSSTK